MSTERYRETIARWSRGIRDTAPLTARAERYRELVHDNISSLLKTNLQRTYAGMGDEAWDQAVARFIALRVQHSPYFVDLAAEFAQTLDDPGSALPDLAHFETLLLEVETTEDEDTRRVAAYTWRVHEPDLGEAPVFLALYRRQGRAVVNEISAADYLQLADELSTA